MMMMISLLLLILSIFLQFRNYYSFPKRGWRRNIMLCLKRNHSSSINMKETQTPDVDVTKLKLAASLTDLHESILDIIQQKLPPKELCRMGAVSTSLREKCISDHLWDPHMKSKWGRITRPVALDQEWQRHLADTNDQIPYKERIMHKLSLWSGIIACNVTLSSPLPADSVLSRYIALENGTFWFPAQIYNRQNGHVGFLLSCYDAKLSYDHRTDTFHARYPSYEMLDIPLEKNVTWDRVRASPVNTAPYDLFHSDSLETLHPGDHLEIQWRRNKELPYGWWYGVVGHVDSCDGNRPNCHCATSDILVLEFSQYSHDSRWRTTLINRRDHIEKGNEDIGFYGGVRKLESHGEISTWLRLWPAQVLEGV